MQHKRIYKCLQNAATGKAIICVTDGSGQPINTSYFDNFDETVCYFHELKDELSNNEQLVIVEVSKFHFECEKIESVSV